MRTRRFFDLRPRALRVLSLSFAVCVHVACTDDSAPPPSANGGTMGAGTSGAAGMPAGGSMTGGASNGGASNGGTSNGGTSNGGASNGGAEAGGTNAGAGMGAMGGASMGGASMGGASMGGASMGGASMGGASGVGGATVGGASGAAGTPGVNWVGTWAAGPQLTEMSNLPPAPGLTNNTLRQIVYVSVGGSRVRVRFSNEYGNAPLTMSAVRLANSTSTHVIDTTTERALTFAGSPSVTVAAGMTVTSDPVDYALAQQTKVAITIAFGSTPSDVTGHPGSRTTSYIVTGNAAGAANLTSPVATEHWYYITGLDVEAPASTRAVVTFGDSITDGRGSTTDMNNRWPDNLSRRLRANTATAAVAVMNQGIGGNAVVSGGLGPTGLSRFERDVLDAPGVRWVIVLHGVNDIGVATSENVAQSLISAYQGFVSAARARGVRIYGAPILPFGGSNYDSTLRESARQTVNAWIRTPGNFDAVIDLDAAVRDPMTPTRLLGTYDSGDALHPNVAGYQRMAEAIELALFSQ